MANYRPLVLTLAISFFVTFELFMWQGNIGFNLWDEGFLWYGSQRVLLGEVPIRDFMAYDPGRYYWSAAFMFLWGDNGIMTLRGAVAVFQALGLAVGLLLIIREFKKLSIENILFLIVALTTLVFWMYPRHKLFDISMSIFLVGILSYLIQNPISKRYFIAGICIGLVAVFGRNHGVYGAVGSLGVMLWLSINRSAQPSFPKGFLCWASGVTLGFSPILMMATIVPGFALAFWESILFLFQNKTTNIPLPVPWPWGIDFSYLSINDAIRRVLVGIFFIAIVTFGIMSIPWSIYQRAKNETVSPTFVAASFIALPYAHYAYSRADLGHLAQGIFPFLIGCFILLARQHNWTRWSLSIILCAASLWVMYTSHPLWKFHENPGWVAVNVSGNKLEVDPVTANDVQILRTLVTRYSPNGESFFTTPYWPGAYALFESKAPVWEIYALFPRPPLFEQKEIQSLKAANPQFVVVFDLKLDGQEALRYKNTHPLTYQYILDNFDKVTDYAPHPVYKIFKIKAGER